MKILIVDDHPVIRQGLKKIISEIPEITIFDEAGTSEEAINKISKENYRLVIMDISMPGIGGLNVLKTAKKLKPDLPVLVVSFHPEEEYAHRAFQAGASGYLMKESLPEELVTAIKKILQGRKYLSPSLAEKLVFNSFGDTGKPPHQKLSNREYEIMLMIIQAKTIKGIAQKLNLDPKTVSTYRSRILRKMKMKNNVELIRYALENKLLD